MYPAAHSARDRFILDRREPRPVHDPWRYQRLIVEDELTDRHTLAPTATIFLTGKECPWRCVMCDLWQYTIDADSPKGAISSQIAAACRELDDGPQPVTQIKLYNASNFFDPRAVPDDDYRAIASCLIGFQRIIVESHPALVGSRIDRFLDALTVAGSTARIEVAMGLETANPQALEQLNKGLRVEDFSDAAGALRQRNVDVRTFLLISPPFVAPSDQDRWLVASVEQALASGSTVVSLIPTRSGNGAMESLAEMGLYREPRLDDIERSLELALHAAGDRARVFVDLWDLERFSLCSLCFAARRTRLQTMNLEQRVRPAISCAHCRRETGV